MQIERSHDKRDMDEHRTIEQGSAYRIAPDGREPQPAFFRSAREIRFSAWLPRCSVTKTNMINPEASRALRRDRSEKPGTVYAAVMDTELISIELT